MVSNKETESAHGEDTEENCVRDVLKKGQKKNFCIKP